MQFSIVTSDPRMGNARIDEEVAALLLRDGCASIDSDCDLSIEDLDAAADVCDAYECPEAAELLARALERIEDDGADLKVFGLAVEPADEREYLRIAERALLLQ